MQSFWGFRFGCCTAQNDAAPSNKEPLSADDDDDDKCPICLEPICGEKPVSPQCNHKFHGQCLVTALLQNPRCPVCRYSPLAADDDLSDSDDGDVTRGEGYARAIERVQTDKAIAKLATTEEKWHKERKVCLAKFREEKRKLKPLRRAMKNKIKDYKTELELKFKKANSKLLEQERAAKNEYYKAAGQHCAARTRIAKKGGYVPSATFRRAASY
jgi:hypothetical protein